MARFVKLDLDQWEPPETPANAAKVANFPVDYVDPRQRLAGLATLADLPADIRAGVDRLKTTRPPNLIHPEVWPVAVADAVYLVESGWAARALAKEWTALHLFGVVVSSGGDPHSDGLAVWLRGRRIVAMIDGCVAVEDGRGRAFYSRREQVGARLIWESDQ